MWFVVAVLFGVAFGVCGWFFVFSRELLTFQVGCFECSGERKSTLAAIYDLCSISPSVNYNLFSAAANPVCDNQSLTLAKSHNQNPTPESYTRIKWQEELLHHHCPICSTMKLVQTLSSCFHPPTVHCTSIELSWEVQVNFSNQRWENPDSHWTRVMMKRWWPK